MYVALLLGLAIASVLLGIKTSSETSGHYPNPLPAVIGVVLGIVFTLGAIGLAVIRCREGIH